MSDLCPPTLPTFNSHPHRITLFLHSSISYFHSLTLSLSLSLSSLPLSLSLSPTPCPVTTLLGSVFSAAWVIYLRYQGKSLFRHLDRKKERREKEVEWGQSQGLPEKQEMGGLVLSEDSAVKPLGEIQVKQSSREPETRSHSSGLVIAL